jgi:polyhydroxyalkanoate synthesis regulator phasin
MGIFDWFGKKNDELYVEHVPNTNMVPDYYTKDEVDALKAELKAANDEIMRLLTLNIVKHDEVIASVRADILALTVEPKPSYITEEQMNFVVETMTKALREEIEDAVNRVPAIVDPAPITAPPAGWMYAIQDEILNKTEMAKAEVRAYVDDCLSAYDAGEDLELEEKLAKLTPISPEEIDALYMDEAETTTLAQKTLNGFRAELYNKAVSDLKLIPTSKATIAAVRAFLVKFVESMKPV